MSDTDVAIVGIGMHEFGRHDGVSGMEQGVVAVRRALRRRGGPMGRHPVRVRRQPLGGRRRHHGVAKLGLTGLQFINVLNGCATGGSALFSAYNTIRSGMFDVGYGRRLRQARARRLQGRHQGQRARRLVRRLGPGPHHAVLRHEDQPLHARPTGSAGAPWPRWPRRRSATAPSTRWRGAASRCRQEEILESAMLSYPLTQYMFCSPGEGGVALILANGDVAKQYTDTADLPEGRGGALATVRLLRGARPVDRARAQRRPHRRRVAGGVRDGRHGPRRHRRGPAPGHRVGRRDHAHGRERLLRAR